MVKASSKAAGFGALWVAALVLGGPVRAEQADPSVDSLMGTAVDNHVLAESNGREGLALNLADLSAVSGLNSANGANTGAASISDHALTNFSGTAAVVVNSGNNALIQVSNQIIFNLY